MKKIICIDFDGVEIDVTSDPPANGAIGWLISLCLHREFQPVIYSSRSKEEAGIKAMKDWILMYTREEFHDIIENNLQFAKEKPAAWLTVDDRAFCFTGEFPSLNFMKEFKPWNK